MTFMQKKKRTLKFRVQLEVEELSSVPSINGVLFAKVRQIHGGTFTVRTSREPIINNSVVWHHQCEFTCSMTTSAHGILEECKCRVSVRKELGKCTQKVGYVDIDLAPYSRTGQHVDRHILAGYKNTLRQDNSVLKVNVQLTLISGDPFYKAPDLRCSVFSTSEHDSSSELTNETKGDASPPPFNAVGDTSSLASSSSGFGSLPRPRDLTAPSSPLTSTKHDISSSLDTKKHHRRDNSACSNNSNTSSIGRDAMTAAVMNGSHSRQSSLGSTIQVQHKDSVDDIYSEAQKNRHLKRLDSGACIEKRVNFTRPNADLLVENLMRNADLISRVNDQIESPGLQLFISQRDGSTVLCSKQSMNKMSAGARGFSQVIMEPEK